jgi:plasmid stabilization system protein ParE
VKVYSIFLTERAEEELNNILDYLIQNWSTKDALNFSHNVDDAFERLTQSPYTYPIYSRTIRKFVLDKHNIIFYRIKKNQIQVLSIWPGKRDPKKLKI